MLITFEKDQQEKPQLTVRLIVNIIKSRLRDG